MTLLKNNKKHANIKNETINEIRSYIFDYILPMIRIDGIQDEHVN